MRGDDRRRLGGWVPPGDGAPGGSTIRLLALAVLGLALAGPGLASGPGVTFEPRAAAELGQTWLERANWHTSGHTLAKLGPVKVRDKEMDDRTHYACGVEVVGMDQAVVTAVGVACTEAAGGEAGALVDLGVSGLSVVGEGLGRDREFKTADGKRLRKKHRAFFERNFRDRPPDEPDPLTFLLPAGPVSAGQSWAMDLDAIQRWFGADRFEVDRAASHATVTFDRVVSLHGEDFGALAFDVVIVPKTIQDGTFEDARMAIRGVATLPLRGSSALRDLELQVDIRFLGTIKQKGLVVHVDLETELRGYEKKEPAL